MFLCFTSLLDIRLTNPLVSLLCIGVNKCPEFILKECNEECLVLLHCFWKRVSVMCPCIWGPLFKKRPCFFPSKTPQTHKLYIHTYIHTSMYVWKESGGFLGACHLPVKPLLVVQLSAKCFYWAEPMWWNEITYGGHWAKRCSTSETCYFNWIQRTSFRTCLSWLHWPFPFSKAAWVLKLIGCENKSDEIAKEPSSIFLGRIYSLIPLFTSDVDRVVVQQLLTPLKKWNISVAYFYKANKWRCQLQ